MEAFDSYKPHLFPRVERAANALGRVLRLGRVTELCLSEHNSGATVMLDEGLES